MGGGSFVASHFERTPLHRPFPCSYAQEASTYRQKDSPKKGLTVDLRMMRCQTPFVPVGISGRGPLGHRKVLLAPERALPRPIPTVRSHPVRLLSYNCTKPDRKLPTRVCSSPPPARLGRKKPNAPVVLAGALQELRRTG